MEEPLVYFTVGHPAEAKYVEKMSRFLAFVVPVRRADEAREMVKRYQNEYHDARHVCWAYMLGPERKEWQLNDNGEPSGTAGKPILGQINSRELTDVLVIVVRYFGGIKLGTSGLIAAYRQAASDALDEAGRVECVRKRELTVTFSYAAADGVMKIVKRSDVELLDKKFDNLCSLRMLAPMSISDELKGRLGALDGVTVDDSGESV